MVHAVGPDEIREARRSLGQQLATLRKATGHTQHSLAPLIQYGRSTIANTETGHQRPDRSFWQRCDEILQTNGVLTAGYSRIVMLERAYQQAKSSARKALHQREPQPQSGNADEQQLRCLPDMALALRRKLLGLRWQDGVVPMSLNDIQTEIKSANIAYQAAEYGSLSQLPDVAAAAEALAGSVSGSEADQTYTALAWANLIMSKLAAKLGDGSLAWVAADRAATWASHLDDAALMGVAVYQTSCALAKTPTRAAEAEDVALAGADRLAVHKQHADPRYASVRGALLLHSAVIAARHGHRHVAHQRLADATKLARGLGRDGNEMWTAFGPTNVLLHQLSVATALNDQHEALQLGGQIDTSNLSIALVGRRAQMHLDLAAAHSATRESDPQAVLHILEAERIAPQAIRHNSRIRTLIAELLGRERRSQTPGLITLAYRAGVAA
ncbi:helix-turn-helix transcriptional regulator [Micromonospora peucetia]|uniref:helix-turn-helix domain-containing protein n=1 Tax=Micromonospora peucetia TaxID=47871 RepID=UPI00332A8F8A